MNLHILSDPVSDFWKCPKNGLKKSYLQHFLVPNFVPDMRHHRPVSHIWLFPHDEDDFECCLHIEETADCCCQRTCRRTCRRTYCHVLYCTVLYCTVPNYVTTTDWNKKNCGSRYWPHDYDSGDKKTYFLREGSFKKKKKPYLGRCPNRGMGSDRIPTSLTDLAKWQR